MVKLVRPSEHADPNSDRLLSGIYLPVPYLDELLAGGATLGPRGGQWLGYDTIDRHLTTTLFVALVREGSTGTREPRTLFDIRYKARSRNGEPHTQALPAAVPATYYGFVGGVGQEALTQPRGMIGSVM